MMKSCLAAVSLCSVVLLGVPGVAGAQSSDTNRAIQHISNNYQFTSNVVYRLANNYEAKLDIYKPRNAKGPNPTLVYFHGGGWTQGAKEGSVFGLMPWMEMGWTIVNVEYRLASVSPAPGAVEDCRCALRWIYRNAKEQNFDLSRIVVMGNSAGAHLALTTGMLPMDTGFDNSCPGDRGAGPNNTDPLKVAAIISWYGIQDVNELLGGANMRSWAVAWLSSLPNRQELAKQLSPLTYVRAGLPPTMLIHGDADPTVPYTQAVRMNEALGKAGVSHEFITVPGGKHGGFTEPEMVKIYAQIRAFLAKNKLPISEAGAASSTR